MECSYTLETLGPERLKVAALNLFHPTTSSLPFLPVDRHQETGNYLGKKE
jgi:hypothetical protein